MLQITALCLADERRQARDRERAELVRRIHEEQLRLQSLDREEALHSPTATTESEDTGTASQEDTST